MRLAKTTTGDASKTGGVLKSICGRQGTFTHYPLTRIARPVNTIIADVSKMVWEWMSICPPQRTGMTYLLVNAIHEVNTLMPSFSRPLRVLQSI
jgi:hypothetical protein